MLHPCSTYASTSQQFSIGGGVDKSLTFDFETHPVKPANNLGIGHFGSPVEPLISLPVLNAYPKRAALHARPQ